MKKKIIGSINICCFTYMNDSVNTLSSYLNLLQHLCVGLEIRIQNQLNSIIFVKEKTLKYINF